LTKALQEKSPCNVKVFFAFSALTLLVGWQEEHPACKKHKEWRGAGVVVCLERGADLHYGPADATATHCLLLQ